MNEKQFAQDILKRVIGNPKLEKWYQDFMHGAMFDSTIPRIASAVRQEQMTIDEAILLSLFIGLSTEPKK